MDPFRRHHSLEMSGVDLGGSILARQKRNTRNVEHERINHARGVDTDRRHGVMQSVPEIVQARGGIR